MNHQSSSSHRTTNARRLWSGLLLCCTVFFGAACSSSSDASELASGATSQLPELDLEIDSGSEIDDDGPALSTLPPNDETEAPNTDDSSATSALEVAALADFTGGDYPDAGTFCAAVVHLGTTIEATGDSDVEQLRWHAETILDRMPEDAREETVGYFEAFADLSRLNAEFTNGSAQPEKLEVARRWIAEDIILVSASLTTDCSPVGPVREDFEFNRRLQLLINNSLDLRDAFEATGDQIEDLNS